MIIRRIECIYIYKNTLIQHSPVSPTFDRILKALT